MFFKFLLCIWNSEFFTFSNVQIYPLLNLNTVGFSRFNRTENCRFVCPSIVVRNNCCFSRSGLNVTNGPNGPDTIFHPSRVTPTKKGLNPHVPHFNQSLNPDAKMFCPRITFSIECKNNEKRNIDYDSFNGSFNKFNTLNPYNGIHRKASNLNQCAKSFYPIGISIPNCAPSPQNHSSDLSNHSLLSDFKDHTDLNSVIPILDTSPLYTTSVPLLYLNVVILRT